MRITLRVPVLTIAKRQAIRVSRVDAAGPMGIRGDRPLPVSGRLRRRAVRPLMADSRRWRAPQITLSDAAVQLLSEAGASSNGRCRPRKTAQEPRASCPEPVSRCAQINRRRPLASYAPSDASGDRAGALAAMYCTGTVEDKTEYGHYA